MFHHSTMSITKDIVRKRKRRYCDEEDYRLIGVISGQYSRKCRRILSNLLQTTSKRYVIPEQYTKFLGTVWISKSSEFFKCALVHQNDDGTDQLLQMGTFPLSSNTDELEKLLSGLSVKFIDSSDTDELDKLLSSLSLEERSVCDIDEIVRLLQKMTPV